MRIDKLCIVVSALFAIACGGDDLSVGELRCVNVRCERTDVGVLSSRHTKEYEAREPALPVTLEATAYNCPREGCYLFSSDMVELERDGAREVLVSASYMLNDEDEDPVRHGIWVGRYRDGILQRDHELVSWAYRPFRGGFIAEESAVALVASPDRERAIAVVMRVAPNAELLAIDEAPMNLEYTLSAYVIEGDSAELAFEQPADLTGWAIDAAQLGDDIVITSERDDGHLEVSRYTLEGELVWRQAMLDSAPEAYFSPAQPSEPAAIERLDGEHVIVRVRRASSYQLVVLDADGEVTWSSFAPQVEDVGIPFFGQRLAVGPAGELLIGTDGYSVVRLDALDDDVIDQVVRERREYFAANVFGLDTDAEGAIYVATQEGDIDDRRFIIDRYTRELDQRTTVRLELDAEADERCNFVVDEGSTLLVSDDGQRLSIAGNACLAELTWPSADAGE